MEKSLIQKGEKLQEILETLKVAQKNITKNYLVIGAGLYKIVKEKLWVGYGNHIKTVNDFFNEIGIKRSTAYHCIKVWQEFGKYLESDGLDIPFRRVIKLLPVAKENKEGWLEKAKTLTEKDFEDEIRKAKGKTSYLECQHDKGWVFLKKCKDCQNIFKATDDDLWQAISEKKQSH